VKVKVMPRPRRMRRVEFQPGITYFKPQGVPLSELDVVTLSFVEVEALHLVDINELSQIEASKKMKISQSTFFRELKTARKKVALALTTGKAIKIENQ
jgi:uncharacterized protein